LLTLKKDYVRRFSLGNDISFLILFVVLVTRPIISGGPIIVIIFYTYVPVAFCLVFEQINLSRTIDSIPLFFFLVFEIKAYSFRSYLIRQVLIVHNYPPTYFDILTSLHLSCVIYKKKRHIYLSRYMIYCHKTMKTHTYIYVYLSLLQKEFLFFFVNEKLFSSSSFLI